MILSVDARPKESFFCYGEHVWVAIGIRSGDEISLLASLDVHSPGTVIFIGR